MKKDLISVIVPIYKVEQYLEKCVNSILAQTYSNLEIILVDDMIDTAGTLCNGAEALISRGAKKVYACCTHGVLSGPAMDRLIASPIKEIVVLDTIDLPEHVKNNPKIKVISCAKLIAKAITSIYSDTSLSAIYE